MSTAIRPPDVKSVGLINWVLSVVQSGKSGKSGKSGQSGQSGILFMAGQAVMG